jgi:hypothetical protein
LGHDWIDVLKMDVDGSEQSSLAHIADLPGDAMQFTQLQLEVQQMSAVRVTARNCTIESSS